MGGVEYPVGSRVGKSKQFIIGDPQTFDPHTSFDSVRFVITCVHNIQITSVMSYYISLQNSMLLFSPPPNAYRGSGGLLDPGSSVCLSVCQSTLQVGFYSATEL